MNPKMFANRGTPASGAAWSTSATAGTATAAGKPWVAPGTLGSPGTPPEADVANGAAPWAESPEFADLGRHRAHCMPAHQRLAQVQQGALQLRGLALARRVTSLAALLALVLAVAMWR